MKPADWTRAGWLAGCLVSACVILAYAALLPRARWMGDEYFLLALMRDQGWAIQKHLYLHWSPRLFSNGLYAAYGHFVNATHRPLSGTCLAILWAGLGGACLLPALRRGGDFLPRLLLGLGIFAAFLAGHQVMEVFYWPGGGLSYLPTLAGLVWFFWCLADDAVSTRRGRIAAAAALAMAAGSSEVGIFAVLCIVGCIGLSQMRDRPWRLWWLWPGTAVASLDLSLLLFGRAGTAEAGTDFGGTLHQPLASLIAASHDFVWQLAAPVSERADPSFVALAASARVALFMAGRWAGLRRGVFLLPFALGLFLAAFATIASAYFQFGALCCERHDTMRACFAVLSWLSLGIWSAARWPPRRAFAAAAWMVAVLLGLVPRAPALLADFRAIPAVEAARARNWQQGEAPGERMTFTNEPQGRLLASWQFPPGEFAASKNLPWWDQGLLNFFQKKQAVVNAN